MSRTTYEPLIDGKVYMGGIDAIEEAYEKENIDQFFDLRGSKDELPHDKSVDASLRDGNEVEDLRDAATRMKEALEEGKTIYFHCNTGRGRTGAMAAALLMELGEVDTVEEAMERAKEARDVVSIRPNFEEALQTMYPKK